jgi:cell division protein FtsW
MPMRKAHDPWLLYTTVGLLLGGLMMVGSSSGYLAMLYWKSPSVFLWKQIAHLGVGLAALILMVKIPYRRLAAPRPIWTLFGVCLFLLVLVFFMPPFGGAHRWIVLGPVRFQPSELAKLFAVLYMAAALTRPGRSVNDPRRVLIPALTVLGTMAVLIVAEPDLGTAAIVMGVATVMALVAGLRWKYFAVLCALGMAAFVAAVLAEPYRLKRIVDFVLALIGVREPSYQVTQSSIALGSGGWIGVGVGQGKQQAFFLPAAHTDFIYAILGEELGLIGTWAVLVGFMLILWRGARTALRTKDPFGAYLAFGLTCWLVLQALIHILVCLGLLPTTGLPLPFISYGGSSLVASMAAMGLLLNVSQECNLRSGFPVLGARRRLGLAFSRRARTSGQPTSRRVLSSRSDARRVEVAVRNQA